MYCRRLCGAYSDGMAKKPTPTTIRPEQIERAIQIVRGQRVLLDADLARFYGVLTKALNQAVKRNAERFPADFAFQLTPQEFAALRSQIVTSNVGRRRPPIPALGLHRTRRGHAFQRPSLSHGGAGERRDHSTL